MLGGKAAILNVMCMNRIPDHTVIHPPPEQGTVEVQAVESNGNRAKGRETHGWGTRCGGDWRASQVFINQTATKYCRTRMFGSGIQVLGDSARGRREEVWMDPKISFFDSALSYTCVRRSL
jgi:hypothetical protein